MRQIALLLLLTLGGLLHAQDARTYLRLGLDYFEAGRFEDALNALDRYEALEPGNPDVAEKRAIALYYSNELRPAEQQLLALTEGRDVNPQVYFFLGRTYHARHDFVNAIQYYKEYLRRTDDDNVNRPMVKDAIRRAANGLRVARTRGDGFVENFGPQVNSKGDDFKPILSPNFDDRVYFSSAREGNLGGLRNDEGFADERRGQYGSDMFSTVVENGTWSTANPMSYLLNSPRYDVVTDFSEQGDRLYYFKGFQLYSGDILVDTFRSRIEERSLFSAEFDGPLRPWEGDTELQIWNDTTVLFASRRAGGYGGLDLYISNFSGGAWTTPENLGPTINTAYDETTPFLGRDGRTLYYSSNRADRSIGGLDVFKTTYEDGSERWTEPENLKLPINSAGDDLHFRLTRDGYRGFFTSSRKVDNYGKRDLYVALFRQVRPEQTARSLPLVFNEVPRYRKLLAGGQEGGGEGTPDGQDPTSGFAPSEIVTYELAPLQFEPQGDLISRANRPTLDKLIQLHDRFPETTIALTAHSDGSDPQEFDLYFSIKRAEEAAAYLVENGVPAASVLVRGVGSSYPVAQRTVNGRENIVGQRLNRRVDIQILNTDGQPIRVNYNRPEVSDFMRAFEGKFFEKSAEQLLYRVQIANQGQMYRGNAILSYPHALVERGMNGTNYRFLVGAVKDYQAARQLRADLVENGVPDAFVVPYVRGRRLNGTPTERELQTFPDLENYLGIGD